MSEEKKDEKTENELGKCKEQAEEYLNGWKRAKADLINYKKDIEKRQQVLRQFLVADTILELLPIHDNFKRAMEHINNVTMKQCNNEDNESGKSINNPKTWFEGIKHIKSQLDKFLKDRGVEEIKTVGEKFNPELHEAIDKRKVEGVEPDIILEESSAGYTIDGKVIVPAKVVVAE